MCVYTGLETPWETCQREREKETERGKGGVSGVGESEEKQAADQVAGWVA